jgi:cell division protein FtsB
VRFERIVGGDSSRLAGLKRIPAQPRREESRPLPELVAENPTRASGARPDSPHVSPASYVMVSLLFSTLVFGFFLVSEKGLLQVRRQRVELAATQAEVSTLDAGNKKLDAEVQALRTDPKAVEKIARETLNLVKPGEIVIVLPDGWRTRVRPPQSAPPASPADASRP